jgi:hypothetical protein
MRDISYAGYHYGLDVAALSSTRSALSQHASCHCQVLAIRHLIWLPVINIPYITVRFLCLIVVPIRLHLHLHLHLGQRTSEPANQRRDKHQLNPSLQYPFSIPKALKEASLRSQPSPTSILHRYCVRINGAFTHSAPVSSA